MSFPICFCLSLTLSLSQLPRDRWFGEDKWKHFFSSVAATTISASGARMMGMDSRSAAWVGAGAGAALGVWKEGRDLASPAGTASFRDLVWDGAGVAAGTAVMLQVR